MMDNINVKDLRYAYGVVHDTLKEYPNGSLVCLKGRLENNNNNIIVVAEKLP